MTTLTTLDLSNVTGGAAKNSELTSALTNIQSSLKDLSGQKNGGFDSTTMLMLGLMMSQQKNSPTVIAGGAAPAAAGPVVNVSTRVASRRWW